MLVCWGFCTVPQNSRGSLAKETLIHCQEDFPEASKIKPTSPDESTARLQALGYSGKTITINSKKEVDLKLSFTLKSQSEVFAPQLPELTTILPTVAEGFDRNKFPYFMNIVNPNDYCCLTQEKLCIHGTLSSISLSECSVIKPHLKLWRSVGH